MSWQKLTQLTQLSVRGQFGDAGAQALASVLPQLLKLTQLSVEGWFGNAYKQIIVQALPSHVSNVTLNGQRIR